MAFWYVLILLFGNNLVLNSRRFADNCKCYSYWNERCDFRLILLIKFWTSANYGNYSTILMGFLYVKGVDIASNSSFPAEFLLLHVFHICPFLYFILLLSSYILFVCLLMCFLSFLLFSLHLNRLMLCPLLCLASCYLFLSFYILFLFVYRFFSSLCRLFYLFMLY